MALLSILGAPFKFNCLTLLKKDVDKPIQKKQEKKQEKKKYTKLT